MWKARSKARAQQTRRDIQQVAMALLARRDHARQELQQKLSARGYPAQEISALLTDFAAQGWLSDQRFAETYMRSHIQRGQGPIRIRGELLRLGLDAEILDALLPQVLAALEIPDWLAQAAAVREKRFGPDLPTDPRSWGQQARFLAQRGFPADLIRRLLG